ncbi:LysR family transcriptional regulator [Affinibrenneria salicis]|uniref:LysR family transcriptional regulator n=1 Tax=Affinibrenneria salicis TaxID=2590031 RepID=A0A5J5FY85_9GAMM|nr:LysR family transcriptional regulator [Affinibrenneria salicis]KAA8998837.1 LysR family transcriptional regulator [Affinibrenneria salicis]
MNKLDNLTAMMVFANVVETLSYTEAANQLNISKSAVSKEISQLEIRLGAKLLQRTTRKIQVTELGLTYYQYCHRILQEIKNSEQFIRQVHEDPVGSLRIAAPVTFGSQCVMPVVNQFIKNNIHITVDLDLTDRPINIEDEHYDVAIAIDREFPPNGSFKPLIDIEWGLYASEKYLRTCPDITHPDQLPRHDYILFRGNAHTIALPFHKDKQRIDVEVHCRLRANNSTALLNAALDNLGIAYLPAYITDEHVQNGSIIRLLPHWQMEVYKSWAMFKQSQFNSPRISLFVDSLQNTLRTRAAQ